VITKITIFRLDEQPNSVDKSGSKKTKAVRNIILIRHGQYDEDAKGEDRKVLTETGTTLPTYVCSYYVVNVLLVGRTQARLTGIRLKQLLKSSPSQLVVSTKIRAMETANFILDFVKSDHSHDELLEEGVPFVPEPRGKADFLSRVIMLIRYLKIKFSKQVTSNFMQF